MHVHFQVVAEEWIFLGVNNLVKVFINLVALKAFPFPAFSPGPLFSHMFFLDKATVVSSIYISPLK